MGAEASKYRPDLLRGSTDCLLLFLVEEQPMYGYQLIKELERRSRGFFQFKEGTVYPTLHRLESEGLIEGQWQRLPNGQERRYYTITGKGRLALRAKMAEWQGFTAAVNLVLKAEKS